MNTRAADAVTPTEGNRETPTGRNRDLIFVLALTAGLRAFVCLVSDNMPGDADYRAVWAATWALHPSLIYHGVQLPFHTYAVGVMTWVFGNPLVAGKVLSFITGTLAVIPFYRLVRRLFDARVALIGGLFFAIYGNHVGLSAAVMSEAPFLLLALWSLDVFFAQMQSQFPRLGGLALAGLLMALAGGFRQEGWQLTGILALYMLFVPKSRKYAVPFGLVGLSTFIAWTIGNMVSGRSFLYALLAVALQKADEKATITWTVSHNVAKWVWILVQSPGPILSVLGLIGMYTAWRRRGAWQLGMIAVLFIVPYIALSVVKTEWAPQARYTVVFGILLLPYAAAATIALFEQRFSMRPVVAAILALSVATQAAAYTVRSRVGLPFDSYALTDESAWRWLGSHAGPNDLVVVEDTEFRSYALVSHSGVYAHEFRVIYGRDSPDTLREILKSTASPALLVLHSPAAKWGFLPRLRPQVVFQNADYTVLRVSAGCASAMDRCQP